MSCWKFALWSGSSRDVCRMDSPSVERDSEIEGLNSREQIATFFFLPKKKKNEDRISFEERYGRVRPFFDGSMIFQIGCPGLSFEEKYGRV